MRQPRPMRRKDRALSLQETLDFLAEGEYGVLSLNGEEGMPYGVPLSYVWMEGSIYFHCALTGYKTDCMRCDPRVCFTVAGRVRPVYDDDGFTTQYYSAMIGGEAEEVTCAGEKNRALRGLCGKYLPEYIGRVEEVIKRSSGYTAVWKITPVWFSGKAKQ